MNKSNKITIMCPNELNCVLFIILTELGGKGEIDSCACNVYCNSPLESQFVYNGLLSHLLHTFLLIHHFQ